MNAPRTCYSCGQPVTDGDGVHRQMTAPDLPFTIPICDAYALAHPEIFHDVLKNRSETA